MNNLPAFLRELHPRGADSGDTGKLALRDLEPGQYHAYSFVVENYGDHARRQAGERS